MFFAWHQQPIALHILSFVDFLKQLILLIWQLEFFQDIYFSSYEGFYQQIFHIQTSKQGGRVLDVIPYTLRRADKR